MSPVSAEETFLDGLGVNVVISGGMGGAAISLFNEMGVIVMTGATGEGGGGGLR